MKRYITCKKWRIEEEERNNSQEGVEQTHILPGGSRLDTTLAVPVKRMETKREMHILPGGRRLDTTLAVPVKRMHTE